MENKLYTQVATTGCAGSFKWKKPYQLSEETKHKLKLIGKETERDTTSSLKCLLWCDKPLPLPAKRTRQNSVDDAKGKRLIVEDRNFVTLLPLEEKVVTLKSEDTVKHDYFKEDNCICNTDSLIGNEKKNNTENANICKEKTKFNVVNERTEIGKVWPFELEAELVKANDILVSCSDGKEFQVLTEGPSVMELSCIGQYPQEVVNEICDKLKISSLNETGITYFTQLVIAVFSKINFSASTLFCQHLFYKKVVSLDKNISRSLMSNILMLAQKCPMAVVAAVVLPCVSNNILGTYQFEVLQRILMDGIPDNFIDSTLSQLLQDLTNFSEQCIHLVQVLVCRKPALSSETKKKLACSLMMWGEYHSSSIKFTKFLLDILTLFKNQPDPNILPLLSKVVQKNKTFMKKRVENALEKL